MNLSLNKLSWRPPLLLAASQESSMEADQVFERRIVSPVVIEMSADSMRGVAGAYRMLLSRVVLRLHVVRLFTQSCRPSPQKT